MEETKPDPKMLENLEMLLDMDVLENESDWEVMDQEGEDLFEDKGESDEA